MSDHIITYKTRLKRDYKNKNQEKDPFSNFTFYKNQYVKSYQIDNLNERLYINMDQLDLLRVNIENTQVNDVEKVVFYKFHQESNKKNWIFDEFYSNPTENPYTSRLVSNMIHINNMKIKENQLKTSTILMRKSMKDKENHEEDKENQGFDQYFFKKSDKNMNKLKEFMYKHQFDKVNSSFNTDSTLEKLINPSNLNQIQEILYKEDELIEFLVMSFLSHDYSPSDYLQLVIDSKVIRQETTYEKLINKARSQVNAYESLENKEKSVEINKKNEILKEILDFDLGNRISQGLSSTNQKYEGRLEVGNIFYDRIRLYGRYILKKDMTMIEKEGIPFQNKVILNNKTKLINNNTLISIVKDIIMEKNLIKSEIIINSSQESILYMTINDYLKEEISKCHISKLRFNQINLHSLNNLYPNLNLLGNIKETSIFQAEFDGFIFYFLCSYRKVDVYNRLILDVTLSNEKEGCFQRKLNQDYDYIVNDDVTSRLYLKYLSNDVCNNRFSDYYYKHNKQDLLINQSFKPNSSLTYNEKTEKTEEDEEYDSQPDDDEENDEVNKEKDKDMYNKSINTAEAYKIHSSIHQNMNDNHVNHVNHVNYISKLTNEENESSEKNNFFNFVQNEKKLPIQMPLTVSNMIIEEEVSKDNESHSNNDSNSNNENENSNMSMLKLNLLSKLSSKNKIRKVYDNPNDNPNDNDNEDLLKKDYSDILISATMKKYNFHEVKESYIENNNKNKNIHEDIHESSSVSKNSKDN